MDRALTIVGRWRRVAMAPTKDIVGIAIEAGSFTTLVAALKAAGLVETLQGNGPFTVFAPTDAAFAKLPAGTVEAPPRRQGTACGGRPAEEGGVAREALTARTWWVGRALAVSRGLRAPPCLRSSPDPGSARVPCCPGRAGPICHQTRTYSLGDPTHVGPQASVTKRLAGADRRPATGVPILPFPWVSIVPLRPERG